MKNLRHFFIIFSVALVLGRGLGAPGAYAIAMSSGQDGRFIGTWVNTHSYVSGDFSAASEKYVQFRADGTFILRTGRVVGGDSSGSFDSGGGGGVTVGQWQTQDKILYYVSNGSLLWQAYGRYGFTDDGRTMMITFANGKKEIWERW